MTRALLLLLITFTLGTGAQAQFGNLLKKAKDKTKDRIDNKVDKEMDKALDKAEGKKPAAGNSNNTAAGGETEEEKTEPEEAPLKSFSKFDFIPGDSILYAEDFQQDQIGELPLNWNTSGSGEVMTLDKYPGNWLRLHKRFTYLTGNKNQFGDNYTIEFDAILQLKNNGWMYPELEFGVFSSGDKSNQENEFLKNNNTYGSLYATLSPGESSNSKVRVHSYAKNITHYASEPKMYDAIEKNYGKPVHISMQVQKERFRMWINSDKIFDAPRAVPPGIVMNQLLFEVSTTNYSEDQYAIYIGNIKVATGKPDTRHKLIEEGKFTTHGILFDFQSAVIKPESYAVVKDIAGVLKENSGIRVKVLGHTSSDGDDNANMELSRKRAAAVKDLLVSEFGIDASRIETEGKGETQPIADNKTREGKIANRRVEFVKL